MALEETLPALAAEVPGCIFTGYIDLEGGALMSPAPADFYTPEEVENLAAAVLYSFESGPMVQVEDLFREATGVEDPLAPYFDEMLVVAGDRAYAFLRLEETPSHVVCVVTREMADLGTLLARLRATLAAKGPAA